MGPLRLEKGFQDLLDAGAPSRGLLNKACTLASYQLMHTFRLALHNFVPDTIIVTTRIIMIVMISIIRFILAIITIDDLDIVLFILNIMVRIASSPVLKPTGNNKLQLSKGA